MNRENRVALITGAAGGIGNAVCHELAAQGAALCLVDTASTTALAAELRATGCNLIEVTADVTSRASISIAVRTACERLGHLDILVNVAGTVSLGAAADISEAEWDRVLAVNLKGTFLACQAAMVPMKAQAYGRIINIGSVLGKTAATRGRGSIRPSKRTLPMRLTVHPRPAYTR